MKFISYFMILATAFTVGGASGQEITTQNDSGDGSGLTQKQIDLLTFARKTAREDGHQYPQYVLGIIMQESKAGDMTEYRVAGLRNKASDRYFGVSQIKLAAAKDVMKRYPKLWEYLDTKTDEELQARLILDDRFNIRVASKYALLMGMNEHPNRAVLAYNQGIGGAQRYSDPGSHSYVHGVKAWAKKVKNILLRRNELESISDGKQPD